MARRLWDRLSSLPVCAGRNRDRLEGLSYVGLVIAFSLFAVLPLAGPGYFLQAHDAPHTIFFLTEFDAAIRDGVWYPGWATDQALGYGYPTFVFYSPLAYYVAEAFHLAGAGEVVALKWTWALATLGAGLAMYAFARQVLGRQRGLLAAVVYVYMPYHLVDIYVRAALAEYCAFVWMPLALLAFHRLVEKVTAPRVALAGLSLGALWLTHNVTGLAFTPLLAAYVLFRLFVERRRAQTAAGPVREVKLLRLAGWKGMLAPASASMGAAFLGLGIGAALLVPNLFERYAINQQQWVQAGYDYANQFVYPFQLVSSFWGYGAAAPGPGDEMSFQLGAIPLVLGMAATVAALHRRTRSRALVLFLASATLLLVGLMLSFSLPVWKALPIASLVQFPWRLLALTTVTLAVLAGLAVPSPKRVGSGALVLMAILVVVLASFPYTLPQYTPVPASAETPLYAVQFERKYPDMVGMTAWTQELPPTSPLVAQYEAGASLVTAEVLAPGASVQMIRTAGASDELWVHSAQGTALRFYTYYYPGWRVYVDGNRLPNSQLRPETVYGLLTVDVPAGEHRVLLRWGDSPVRFVGKALTLASLGVALALVVPWRRLGKRAKS